MKFTSDGVEFINLNPGQDYVVFIAGNFGGGTVNMNMKDATESAVMPMPEHGTVSAELSYVFTAPAPMMAIELFGATSPSLVVDITPCRP
jgi:hypothetical protein